MKHLISILLTVFLISIFGCQDIEEPLQFSPNLTGITNDKTPQDDSPAIVVTGRYMFPMIVSGIENAYLILDLPPGKSMKFCWSVQRPCDGDEYRFGWDILDLNDDMEWETPFMPFESIDACSNPRSFFFGTHTFHIEVVNADGDKTRASIKINTVPTAQSAVLDIRPTVCPNNMVTHSRGVIQAVLLGTETMDVHTIYLESIRMGGAAPLRTTIEDIYSLSSDGGECACSEKTEDGRDDLIMTFRVPDMVSSAHPKWPVRKNNRLEIVLFLWGDLTVPGGITFAASDCVWIPGPPRKACRKTEETETTFTN